MSAIRDSRRPVDDRSAFLGVIGQPRSYRNILYLLLGLPLGTMYFTVLVTGVSVGLGLMIVALMGIPILIGLWYVVRAFMRLERGLANGLLAERIGPIPPTPQWTGGLWAQFKALMRDGTSWRGFWYLVFRFPVGIATFTIAVTLIAVPLGLAFAPVYMWTSDDLTWAGRTFDPFPWSFALIPLGVVMVFASLHVMNRLAEACGFWARRSLGHRQDPLPRPKPVTETDFRRHPSDPVASEPTRTRVDSLV